LPAPDAAAHGWNVKPSMLLRALDEDGQEAVWIDSDIIVHRDFRPMLKVVTPEMVSVAEEVYWGNHQGGTCRTAAWGLPIGRSLPATANSGFVRVTPEHRPLLHDWQEMLAAPAYLVAQTRAWKDRPLHLLGDQEVLTALLGSQRYADVPIHYLCRGLHIVQASGAAGYTVSERLLNLVLGRSLPPLVHSQGLKPWNPAPYHERVQLELSPYTAAAREYRDSIEQDSSWMETATWPGRLLAAATGRHPTLQGLPLAVTDTLVRRVKRIAAGLWRRRPRFAGATTTVAAAMPDHESVRKAA
jgi:hypothetical protein